MRRRLVFMFSGQGSQYRGMARELFAADEGFRRELVCLDGLAQTLTGGSVIESFLAARDDAGFSRLSQTHPAIFLLEVALARRLMSAGFFPDAVLGCSLGEFAALVTAGVLGAADALSIVCGHARAIESSCRPGGMLAVLASPRLFDEAPEIFAGSWLAAVHYESHFVVSGDLEAISAIERTLRARAITHARLAVDYAFHSPLVSGADRAFVELAQSVVWRRPRCQVVSCAEGAPLLDPGPPMALGITGRPIRFQAALAGMESSARHTYVDLGPSGTLATFVKYALPAASGSRALHVISPRESELVSLRRVLDDLQSN